MILIWDGDKNEGLIDNQIIKNKPYIGFNYYSINYDDQNLNSSYWINDNKLKVIFDFRQNEKLKNNFNKTLLFENSSEVICYND